jgi:hypothetical protein
MDACHKLARGALSVAMAVTGVALTSSPASAKPTPKPLKVVDAHVTVDDGTPGVLEQGDSFDIVLDKPIMVYAPSFAVRVTDADGDSAYLTDNGSEVSYSVEDLVTYDKKGRATVSPDRVLALTIRDAYGGLVPLDLPVRITSIEAVYYAGSYDEPARVDLARSRDTVIDAE